MQSQHNYKQSQEGGAFDDDDQVLFQASQAELNSVRTPKTQYSIYDSHPQNAFFNQQTADCCNSQSRRVVTAEDVHGHPEQFSLLEHAAAQRNNPQAYHQRQHSPIPGYQVVYTKGTTPVPHKHERSGFITSYHQVHKTKEQLNLNLLEQRRLSQKSPELRSVNQSQQVVSQQRRFTDATSPSCKQKMSPRTHQPSNWAITVPIAPRVTMNNQMPTQPKPQHSTTDLKQSSDRNQFYERLMPPNDTFSLDELVEQQSKSSNITSGISDSVGDGVDEEESQQQEQMQHRQPLLVESSKEQTESNASENPQYVLQPNEYLSFSQDRIVPRVDPKFDSQLGYLSQQMQSVATCRFGDDNFNATGGNNTQSSSVAKQTLGRKQQPVPLASIRARVVSRNKYSNQGSRTSRQIGGSAVDITVSSAFAHHQDLNNSTEQPLKAAVSKSQVQDFVKKQMEYEQTKALKIRQAKEEKQKRENAEFSKNATFKPRINRPKATTQTSLLKRKAQSPSQVQSRTFKQFVNDQNSYLFKTQRKVEEQRQKMFIEQSKEETHKPRMNRASEAICKKIQAEFYQQLMNKERESCELSQTQGLIITDQSRMQNDLSMIRDSSIDMGSQGPPLMPRTTNTSEIMPLMHTKAKKSPSNKMPVRRSAKKKPSPVAQKLLAQKKAMAKAVPQAPTFAPKINQKSARIVKNIQKKCIMGMYGESPQLQIEQSQRNTEKMKSPKTLSERNMFTVSSANTQREAKIRIEESPSQEDSQIYFDESSRRATEPRGGRIEDGADIKQPRTPQALPQTARSDYSQVGFFNPASSQNDSMNASTNRSRMKTSKSPLNTSNISSNTRQGPRIAEVKQLNEQLKTMQDKKQADASNKKYNENLVLRNFKKEFDSIMMDTGLGPIQLRDMIEIENTSVLTDDQKTLQQKDSVGTISTTHYFSAYSHEELYEEQIKVDIALILFKLGFLSQISSPKDTSKSLLGIYEATLDDKEQKRAFKLNLFSVLNAIQAINLKDHFKLYATFGVLQHHILEDITLQVDLSQLGHSSNSPKSRSDLQPQKQQSSDTPCQVSLLIEALMNLALQPFPFSLNHSHLVKMHLTFMSFFLNRKDNISRSYRQNLQDQEEAKFKYSPSISHTQQSFSPNKQRTPLSEPNRYYDQLKKNIKERAAKLSSMKAEKERKNLDECTFRPLVNPMSTKIAYKQVAELHVPQREFAKTYMPVSEGTSSKEDSDKKSSQIRLSSPNYNNQNVQQLPQSRLSNRINKLMNEYVQDKRSGKKQDISTEQKEFDKQKDELSFRPNIAKSQLSLALAVRKSPQLKLPKESAEDLKSVEDVSYSGFPDLNQQRISEKLRIDQVKDPQQKGTTTPLLMKRMAQSPLGKPSSPMGKPVPNAAGVKQRTIMFARGPASFAAAKGKDTYGSRLKQQIDKRKKSPIKTTKTMTKKQKTTADISKKQSSVDHVQINLTSPPLSRNHESLQHQTKTLQEQEQECFPQTIESVKRRDTLQSYLHYDNSQSEMTHSDFFPEVSAYAGQSQQQLQRSESKQHPAIFVQGESDTVSQIDESTGVFGGGLLNSLRAPPSVVDIMATKGQKDSVSSSADKNAGEVNEEYVQMRAQVQESSDEFSDINEDDLGGNQYIQQEQEPQHHQESTPLQWELQTDPRIEFLLPIEEESKSTFETPQGGSNQAADYQTNHSQEGRIPFSTDMCAKEENEGVQYPLESYRTSDRSNNIVVDRINRSQTGTSENSAEIPSQLLMPRSNCSVTNTPSPVYEHQVKEKVFFADRESKVEWTSEFANVVQDMITVNTCSKASDPNVYYPGGGPPTLLRASLKKSQLQQVQRFSHMVAGGEDRVVQRRGTDPDFNGKRLTTDPDDYKCPQQIVETLEEDQEIAYEKSLEQDNQEASGSPEYQQEEESENNKEPVYHHYHGSPAKSMNSQATSPQSSYQPYVYMNEESQSQSEEQQQEQEAAEKQSFIDNSIQLGMLGTNPATYADKESSDSMPRLYRANTNEGLDHQQFSEQRISLQPQMQHQISEEPQPRLFTNIDKISSKGLSSNTTGENRSPKVAEFNDSSLMSEVRISALDNFQAAQEPSPDSKQIDVSPLDYGSNKSPSDG